MFYTEKSISENLICPLCEELYDYPSILPCGDSICKHHITDIIAGLPSNAREFKCPLCEEDHDLPKNNSFPVNKMILRMMKQKPTEIIQSSLVREFKDNLNKCNGKVYELKKKLTNNGIDFINEHCQELKTKVHLAIEYRKQELDKFGDEMLEQINQFESERIKFIGI